MQSQNMLMRIRQLMRQHGDLEDMVKQIVDCAQG